MVKVILGDLLENKVGRMRRERSSTFSEKGDTPMVCVGRKVKIVVVVIVDDCHQRDKVIRMRHPVANSYQ